MKLAIFKYATSFGGGEKYTQILCDELALSSRPSEASGGISLSYPVSDISVALVSNCKKLITDCRADFKIHCRRLPEAKTRKEILTLILLWPVEMLNYFLIAARLRVKGHRAILLQDLNEKLIMTPICRLLGIRVFWVEHTNWQPHLIRHPFFPILKWSMRIVDKVIVPSRQLSEQIINATDVISNPDLKIVDEKSHEISRFRPSTIETRDDAYSKIIVIPHGVPKTVAKKQCRSKRIVAIARLSPEKGIDLLIDAVAKICANIPVIIIGDGNDKIKMATLARRQRVSVRFMGHVDSPYKEISKNDIFVLPSRIENFPLSVLEALSAGLVIVAPNIGGVPEILADTKNLMFDVGNADSLSSSIKKALSLSPGSRILISIANQKLWQKRYNSTEMVRKILRTIINPNGSKLSYRTPVCRRGRFSKRSK